MTLLRLIILSILPFLISARLAAQQTIPVLLLSDIHFDPLADAAKVPRLNAAPYTQWRAILDAPDSPTRAADYARINATCPIVPLLDPDEALWRSSLAALHDRAAHATFAVLSGDLISHRFDCRYHEMLPGTTHAQFLAFVEKTIRYVVSGLRSALPGVPLYIAMGNNDSACSDNQLNPNDELLAVTARVVAEALPAADRAGVRRDFPHGYYAASLPAPLGNTRIFVLDDVYQMASYKNCSAELDPAAQQPELAWLASQFDQLRTHHQRAWVVGHVAPGINVYSSYNKHADICSGAAPVKFLSSESPTSTGPLNRLLTANADLVPLALFGHSHTDEFRLLHPDPVPDSPADAALDLTHEVAVKILPSISPVFAHLPAFTLARIDTHTAILTDYTVIMASNATGIGTTWAPTYTFSSTYQLAAFTPATLTTLAAGFAADPAAQSPLSQAYLREYRHYYADDHSVPVADLWVPHTCAITHTSAASFIGCACPAK